MNVFSKDPLGCLGTVLIFVGVSILFYRWYTLTQTLDYGTGLALQFYQGYLKIILADHGSDKFKSFKARIEDYEVKEGVTFPTLKLFILIPLSSHCPTDLSDYSDGLIEKSKSLEELLINRAGVRKRSYKNTVYKMYFPEETQYRYFVAEYATPLQTLSEVIQSSADYGQAHRCNKDEIIKNFYTTLQSLIQNDPYMRELCTLIIYNDFENDKPVNLTPIIRPYLKNTNRLRLTNHHPNLSEMQDINEIESNRPLLTRIA